MGGGVVVSEQGEVLSLLSLVDALNIVPWLFSQRLVLLRLHMCVFVSPRGKAKEAILYDNNDSLYLLPYLLDIPYVLPHLMSTPL